MTAPEVTAIERLTEALADPTGKLSRRAFHARVYELSMQWPSLAAAIGDLLAEHDLPIPGPLRAARNAMQQERDLDLKIRKNIGKTQMTKRGPGND